MAFKKNYSDDTVYFISYARLPNGIAAGKLLEVVGIGLIINKTSGVIEDISCTLITEEAKLFIKDIAVGFNLHDRPIEDLLTSISLRYHGLSQKAVCVAISGAYDRYIQWLESI